MVTQAPSVTIQRLRTDLISGIEKSGSALRDTLEKVKQVFAEFQAARMSFHLQEEEYGKPAERLSRIEKKLKRKWTKLETTKTQLSLAQEKVVEARGALMTVAEYLEKKQALESKKSQSKPGELDLISAEIADLKRGYLKKLPEKYHGRLNEDPSNLLEEITEGLQGLLRREHELQTELEPLKREVKVLKSGYKDQRKIVKAAEKDLEERREALHGTRKTLQDEIVEIAKTVLGDEEETLEIVRDEFETLAYDVKDVEIPQEVPEIEDVRKDSVHIDISDAPKSSEGKQNEHTRWERFCALCSYLWQIVSSTIRYAFSWIA